MLNFIPRICQPNQLQKGKQQKQKKENEKKTAKAVIIQYTQRSISFRVYFCNRR